MGSCYAQAYACCGVGFRTRHLWPETTAIVCIVGSLQKVHPSFEFVHTISGRQLTSTERAQRAMRQPWPILF